MAPTYMCCMIDQDSGETGIITELGQILTYQILIAHTANLGFDRFGNRMSILVIDRVQVSQRRQILGHIHRVVIVLDNTGERKVTIRTMRFRGIELIAWRTNFRGEEVRQSDRVDDVLSPVGRVILDQHDVSGTHRSHQRR